MQKLVLAAFFAVSFSATALASPILLVGQTRQVHSGAFVTNPIEFDSDAQTFTAPDPAPFDASAISEVAIEGGTASGTGTQVSTIGAHVIEGAGILETTAEVTVPDGSAYANGSSNVALRFMVQNATTYMLEGFVEASGNGYTTVQFSRPFLTVEFFSATDQRVEFVETGSIEPGTYDFNITSTSAVNASFGAPAQGSGGYDIRLVLGSATGVPLVSSAALTVFPNPFSERTNLVLSDEVRSVRVIDLAGRVVRTIEGSGTLVWDGRDDAGRQLGNGVYWMRPEGAASEPLRVVRVR